MKGNLSLHALCSFRKSYVSDMILCVINSREKTLGVRKIGRR
jgi:hypothetical protein